MSGLPPVVVLISGRGSNLGALLAAGLPVQYRAVISNRADAAGLDLARAQGIPVDVLDHQAYADRAAFDTALADRIDAALGGTPDRADHRDAKDTGATAGLVILAGFMRILTPAFTTRYAGRMINIHPSLLPCFTGLHTHERALAAGVRLHGCTVHYVTAELDHGPIIAQAAVPVCPDDTSAILAARVLRQEHQLYPAVVRAWAEGRLQLGADGRVLLQTPIDPDACLRLPSA